jgi:hypothetical protein
MNNVEFYLTNTIHNADFIDNCADYFLSPLQGLLKLAGKTIKVHEVDVTSNHTAELQDNSKEENQEITLKKVIIVFAQIILFIPATLIGLCLKGIAQLEEETREKYKILFSSIQFYSSVNNLKDHETTSQFLTASTACAVNEPGQNRSVNLNKDVILTHVLPHLSPQEILKLRGTNKSWWNLISKPSSQAVDYLKTLKGVPKKEEKFKDYSFCSLLSDCNAYAKEYHLSPLLINLFGGIHNFLRIRLLRVNQGHPCIDPYAIIDDFAHEPKFQNLPPVVRLLINKGGDDFHEEEFHMEEFIIIKYTLFIPKEGIRKSILNGLLPNDTVWHDYLILNSYILNRYENKKWKVSDARVRAKRQNKYPDFPYTNDFDFPYPPLLSEILDERWSVSTIKVIETLLKNKPVGLFRPIKNGIYDRQKQPPSFILGQEGVYPNRGRIFKDIPALLGHVSLDIIKKVLQEEHHPNYILKQDGTAELVNSDSPTKVITF